MFLRIIAALAALAALGARGGAAGQTPGLDNPIVFVTQVPVPPDPRDLLKIGATFGNHSPDAASAGRGGDLWIRYPDGSLKNLTAAAGYGTDAVQQGLTSIAVRDPSVHWDGTTVIFSMVVGMDTYTRGSNWSLGNTSFWQIYEITGLGQDETPRIHKVPGQPDRYNNLTPVYTSDDRIVFTSDRPRNGARHLYPQHDEYDIRPIVSGVWLLDPATGGLRILAHSPSGAFTPIVDSFGRIIFTQWDHLQRDQKADFEILDCEGTKWFAGVTNWSDESAESVPQDDSTEVFPEPRECRTDLLAGTPMRGHRMSHFFPWQMRQDGHGLETLNHIGRQELTGWVREARTDDPNVVESAGAARTNPNVMYDMFHVKEDPTRPGHYIGTQAMHFETQSGGQIVGLDGHPDRNADEMLAAYITHPDTAVPSDAREPAGSDHSGLYRDPIRTTDGTYVAVHTAETRRDENEGSAAYPKSRYDYRIKALAPTGDGHYEAATPLTDGIFKRVRYVGGPEWDRVIIEYDGELWELQPVELVARPRPPVDPPLFAEEDGYPLVERAGFDVADLRRFLVDNDLALMASRNVTIRDDADVQQPFNLRIPGGVETIGASGTVYDVAFLQIFQADQLRSLLLTNGDGETNPVQQGRRVLAQPLHDPAATAAGTPAPRTAPPGSVAVAFDGSAAAFVPAGRALSWQLTDPDGRPVVRERYWLTFQPGEIRVCGSCHGVNDRDQAGRPKQTGLTDLPVALDDLLRAWAGR